MAARVARDSTQRPEVRLLIIRALAAGIGDSTGDGYSDEDIDVGGREDWHAKTYGELWDCARSVVKLLVELLSDPNNDLWRAAAANLIDHAAEFVRNRAHEPLLAAASEILAIDPRVGTFREELERCLAVDQFAEDVDKAVRAAIAAHVIAIRECRLERMAGVRDRWRLE